MYPLPVLQALMDETHRLGKKAACHAFGGDGLHFSIAAGCDSVEHGYGLTQAQLDEMVKKTLYFDPTLVRYTEPYGRQRCQEHGRQVPDDSDLRQSGGNGRGDKGLKVLVGSGADGSTPTGRRRSTSRHWSSDRA